MAQPKKSQDLPQVIGICFEIFSLDKGDAAALLRKGLDDQTIYSDVLAKVNQQEATEEILMALRTSSGESATVEAISEQIYPTEWEPVYLKPAADPKNSPAHAVTAATAEPERLTLPPAPTSFETRNTGWTMEAQATLSSDSKLIDLLLKANRTSRVPDIAYGDGIARVTMPVFETQRFDGHFAVKQGLPYFCGTMNRALDPVADKNELKRVWLTFVTPTLMPR